MEDKIIVNTRYLCELHNIMNKKGKMIEDIKNNILLPTLKLSENYLTTPTQIDKANEIKTKINEIEKNIKSLASKLERIIIPGYEDTTNCIKNMFNKNFQSELDDYLKILTDDK